MSAALPSGAGLSRHFEGWPLGLLAVVMALLAGVLFLPRPADSLVLPLPAVDWKEAAQVRELDQARAAEALAEPLPFDIRALGERIRRYGTAEHERRATTEDHRDARRTAQEALRKHGIDALLRLRAVQLHFFLQAFEQFRENGIASEDLSELGGRFLKQAERGGWLDSPYPINLDELGTLYRMRWVEIAGLGKVNAFRPTLNEWRLVTAFRLRHLDRSSAGLGRGLRYVDELAERDGAYPEMLAKGVLYFRHQAYPLAVEAFQRHLESQPHGSFGLSAKNYLAGALTAAGGTAE